MVKKTNKILIIGSAPDSVSASNWKNFIFNNIVVINNAWKIRKDWTNCIYPEDFPINKRPKKVNQKQTLHSADDYVKAFVKDVNRAKVIKAKIIMKSVNEANDIDKSNLIKVNEDQFIEEFLPQIVCSNSNCEVVDKSGNVKGYISNKELQTSLTKS